MVLERIRGTAIQHVAPMHNTNQSEAADRHYRADVDGLRAVAVLAVVFYHYGFAGFRGGFVGVDIFFVISGYLITTLIHSEMCNGRFSLVNFYERRVRRIFPALFGLLAVVTTLAFLLLLPSDLIRFGKSLIAATFFSANFLFWHEGGYFDAVSTVKPLLHTWSLAVEEQFYLIYPTVLLAFHKIGRGRVSWYVGALFLASLAVSIVGVRVQPTAAFYLLPARTWELMLGAFLALSNYSAGGTLVTHLLGMAGIAMIGISIIAYGDTTPFPGGAALLPCVGAALIIYSGSRPTSIVSKALASRVPVLIGLISYSLYLWHWPLYVFASYFSLNGLTILEKLALILLSLVLAWCSYRYVETPFRGKKGMFSRNALFRSGFLAMGLTGAFGAALVVAHGCQWRYKARVRLLAAGAFDTQPSLGVCLGAPLERISAGGLCRLGSPDAPISFLLWGDSHAQFLAPAVSEAASRRGVAGFVISAVHCPPLLGVEQSDKPECREVNDRVAQLLLRRREISEVILAARWSRFAIGTPYAHDESRQIIWSVDSNSTKHSLNENKAVFSRGLERTLYFLNNNNKKVVVIGPVPEVEWTVPETAAKLLLLHSNFDLRPSIGQFNQRQQYVTSVLDRMRRKYSMRVLDPSDILCHSGQCDIQGQGRAYYVDAHHLSVFGGEQLVPLLEQAFPSPLKRSKQS